MQARCNGSLRWQSCWAAWAPLVISATCSALLGDAAQLRRLPQSQTCIISWCCDMIDDMHMQRMRYARPT